MQNSSLPQNNTERPSDIVCIAYCQLSMMTGIKDPTEQPKVEEMNQGNKQSNAVVKRSITDLKIYSMQSFIEFSKEMTESFRLCINEFKIWFEQFHEQHQVIFNLFSQSNLQKWIQREQ